MTTRQSRNRAEGATRADGQRGKRSVMQNRVDRLDTRKSGVEKMGQGWLVGFIPMGGLVLLVDVL